MAHQNEGRVVVGMEVVTNSRMDNVLIGNDYIGKDGGSGAEVMETPWNEQ